jgi:hypothetical protein
MASVLADGRGGGAFMRLTFLLPARIAGGRAASQEPVVLFKLE